MKIILTRLSGFAMGTVLGFLHLNSTNKQWLHVFYYILVFKNRTSTVWRKKIMTSFSGSVFRLMYYDVCSDCRNEKDGRGRDRETLFFLLICLVTDSTIATEFVQN